MKIAFITLGCKVNQFESETMAGLFKKAGHEVVSHVEKADAYIINTCSVTQLGEKKSRQLIRRAAHLNPRAVIAVTGCYAQLSPEEIKTIEGVNIVLGTNERKNIVAAVESAFLRGDKADIVEVGDIMREHEFEDIPMFGMQDRTRAYLKIQDGCNNFCSYCIIPYARGPLRSRSLASIRSEVDKLVAEGFGEIVLTGIHLGAYGRERKDGTGLEDAVETALANDKLCRLRLGSLESIEVSNRLLALMQNDSRFARHLHLPLQAGADSTLAAMNRHYTTKEFAALLKNITATIEGIAISTDVIVGFPGETEEEFAQSLAFIESQPFAKIHVFPYSRRRGTPAAAMSSQVDKAEKKRRVHALAAVSERKQRAFCERFLGQEMRVIFEQQDEDGYWSGHTDNYIKVYAKGNIQQGQLISVKLARLFRDGAEAEEVQ